MTGEELYLIWEEAMSACAMVHVASWAQLTDDERAAWTVTASQVDEEIDAAVVEVLPGRKAGERTD